MIISKQNLVEQLTLGQITNVKPASSKIKIPYHLILGEIRMLLAKRLFKPHAKSFHNDVNSFPSVFQDNSVDRWLKKNIVADDNNKWTWPENKRCALILSHDTDTSKQEKGINLLIDTAAKRGLKNTFSFVGKNIPYYDTFLMEIKSRGIEIALHDYVHDNMISFMDKESIKERLSNFSPDKLSKYDIQGFRSPSWYVSPNLWDALSELDFTYDMSALDTYPLFEKGVNKGVCTYFPFIINKIVILPNTIPFELPWYLGYKVNETFDFWKKKFDDIAMNNGLIMFNAHPDRWFCGNNKANFQLEKSLDYIIDKYDPVKLTAKEVASHTNEMMRTDKMIEVDSNQQLYVPGN